MKIFEKNNSCLRFKIEKRNLKSSTFDVVFYSWLNFKNTILTLTNIDNKNTFKKKNNIKEYILKFNASFYQKGIKFRNYTNVIIITHLKTGIELKIYYDTVSEPSLIIADVIKLFYSNSSIFRMNNDRIIQC